MVVGYRSLIWVNEITENRPAMGQKHFSACGNFEITSGLTQIKASPRAFSYCGRIPMKTTTRLNETFDVRQLPGRTKHAQIFQRWLDLPAGEYFVLLNDHDPVPLRYQFEAEFPSVFSWEYLEKGPEDFRVKITKLRPISRGPAETRAPRSTAAPVAKAGPSEIVEIDARGFEPPEPLLRILEALERLPAGKRLRATTDREPCHLFGEAEQRGFQHECTEQPNGSYQTVLWRA
jgi:uncharacterized protein (DUF2249 family)